MNERSSGLWFGVIPMGKKQRHTLGLPPRRTPFITPSAPCVIALPKVISYQENT